ncbi:MAG: FMN-binding protein [Actinobacteria bacterium]|nr:FMN-binding protein [Actinomycetota bacterium]
MKKIFYALLTTVSAVVLVFSYHTSLQGTEAPQAVATGAGSGAAGSDAGTDAGSGTSSGSNAGSSGSSTSSGSGGTSASGSASGSGSGSGSGSASSGTLVDGVYTGAATPTRYGTVQVQVTVKSGRISAVTVPQYPSGGGRTQAINSQAIPQLVSETIGETTSAQSASISMISGATYTSDGYLTSLQSALDQAKS